MKTLFALTLPLILANILSVGHAATGDPIAVKLSPNHTITLESFSGDVKKIDLKEIGEAWQEPIDIGGVPCLIVPRLPVDPTAFAKLVASTQPVKIVVCDVTADDAQSQRFSESLPDGYAIRGVGHNTLAIGDHQEGEGLQREIVFLSSRPWQMPTEMETLFAAMEAACQESQDVFSKLTVDQMNFRPANGTHTPRWNAEHMRGRQLGFFSQIYHAIDPTIPVMDFNPKQMPKDYVPLHREWSGAEESAETKRVSDYCRRYAYLLDGVSLDDKPPASRWPTLRALLKQMARHYGEHTANVVKKFELPDWPES